MTALAVYQPLTSLVKEDFSELKEVDIFCKEFCRDDSSTKVSPCYPYLKHTLTTQFLWFEGCSDPCGAGDELCKQEDLLVRRSTRTACSALPAKLQDESTAFVTSLRASTKNKDLHRGIGIHNEILKQGLLHKCSDALVTMYAKCGQVGKAKAILDMYNTKDVTTWTSVIAGFARDGHGHSALDCFEHMQHEGVSPNAVTYLFVLKACAALGSLDKGKDIHKVVEKLGLLQDNILLGTTLVDMYAKCDAFSKAQGVLEKLPYRDVVCWNALITGYAQKGLGEQALDCFKRMQREGVSPNAVTYLSLLKACAAIGSADRGEQFHDEIVRQGLLQDDISLGNALVDMYAKCGALSKAQDLLEKLPSRDVVSWSSLIAGYVQEHQSEQALQCFYRMQQDGIPPDTVAFVCVLNACSHLGLVEEGYALFANMSTYGLKPNLECYTCMIDLFGRAGHLEKAVQLIQEMSASDEPELWLALLSACRKWGDVNVGRWAFEQVVRSGKSKGPAYVLMGDIYAAAGMHEVARNFEAVRINQEQSIEEAVP